MKPRIILLILFAIAMAIMPGCAGRQPTDGEASPADGAWNGAPHPADASYPTTDRESMIPKDAIKVTPETDIYLPVLLSDEFEEPVPLGPPINTRGAEDSPFVMPDGNTIYVWFTPSPAIPVEKQLFDNVTGIYVYKKENGAWGEPRRIWLNDPGVLGLDGCLFVQNDTAWFCSAREGYTGMGLFTAKFVDGNWTAWQPAPPELKEYEAGEMHISADGGTMYFHSARAGGKGGLDIWATRKSGGRWQPPANLAIMNSPGDEGWPFVSQDGSEFWFTRVYLGSPALLRSKITDGQWSEPELMVSQFAGEPTLDDAGNLYFTHHFYDNGTMLEADIYVAYRK